MDQGVVVGEVLKLGAQEVVAELLGDRPLKGEGLQLHAGVVGLVLLCGTQPSTYSSQNPPLSILIVKQDGAQTIMACVCLEDEGLGEISNSQDRSRSQCCVFGTSNAR